MGRYLRPAAAPVLILGLLCLARVPALAAGLVPLSPEQRRVIEAPPDEKPYQVRLHFLTSNEKRHDLFFAAIVGRGGAYVGVGADQNYTLAAVARAELLFLFDIDDQVVQWHRIYAALVPVAQSAAELADLLDSQHSLQVAAALDARWPADQAPALFRAYQRDRGRIYAHLRQEQKKPGTWLSDPALYAAVRTLMLERRVIMRVGDLHGERTLLAMAEAARAARLPVRVVYLSNAEQWFRYSPQFRRNLAALPRDGRSVVLRTLARRELPAPTGDRWHFSVQTLDDFVQRLQGPVALHAVFDLMGDMLRAGSQPGATRGLSLLPGTALPLSLAPPGGGPGATPTLSGPVQGRPALPGRTPMCLQP